MEQSGVWKLIVKQAIQLKIITPKDFFPLGNHESVLADVCVLNEKEAMSDANHYYNATLPSCSKHHFQWHWEYGSSIIELHELHKMNKGDGRCFVLSKESHKWWANMWNVSYRSLW